MLNKEQQTAILSQVKAAGFPVATGNTARQKYTGGESLNAGTYTPVFQGQQPAILCPPRRKGGEAYEAIAFKDQNGQTVKVGLGSIFNSIRVVTNMAPAALAKGAKWAGEQAQPTKNYFRFGALSNMAGEDVLDPDDNSTTAYYSPSAFTLGVEVVYVAPRFVPGSNRPVFDEQCDLRKAYVVADYLSHEDTNAQR